jgi:hypothetical protein
VRQPSGSCQPPPRQAGPDPAGSGRRPGSRVRLMPTIRTQIRSSWEGVIITAKLGSNSRADVRRRLYVDVGTPRGTSRRTRTAFSGRVSARFGMRSTVVAGAMLFAAAGAWPLASAGGGPACASVVLASMLLWGGPTAQPRLACSALAMIHPVACQTDSARMRRHHQVTEHARSKPAAPAVLRVPAHSGAERMTALVTRLPRRSAVRVVFGDSPSVTVAGMSPARALPHHSSAVG